MFNRLTISLILFAIWLNSDTAAEASNKLFGDQVLAIMSGDLDGGR